MANTDYTATIKKLRDWAHDMTHVMSDLESKYERIKYAIDTGEADPNNIMLTPEQKATLEADIVALNAEIDALCSAHDVEPVELPEPEEPEEE